MKITLLVTLLFGLVFLTTVGAAERTLTPQQQRMTCLLYTSGMRAIRRNTQLTAGMFL